jgi:hypothetical protein
MSIWLPKILMHEREHLSLNPYTGEERSAWNLAPFGVWYTPSTEEWTLEQEKAEFWFHFFTFGIYFVISRFVHSMRVWVEVWSRAIQIRAQVAMYAERWENLDEGVLTGDLIQEESYKIANHKAYRIHLTAEEIEVLLWKRLQK